MGANLGGDRGSTKAAGGVGERVCCGRGPSGVLKHGLDMAGKYDVGEAVCGEFGGEPRQGRARSRRYKSS